MRAFLDTDAPGFGGHDWAVLRMQPRFDLPAARLDALVADNRDEVAWLESLG